MRRPWPCRLRHEVRLVPDADARQDGDRHERRDGEPRDAALPVRQHDERRQQRAHRRPGVAANLEERLGEAMPAADR